VVPDQDSIGGNARTVVVACLSPAGGAARESASTLAFAQRAGQIRNAAVVNEDTRGDAALLAAEVARLRTELAQAADACARLQQVRGSCPHVPVLLPIFGTHTQGWCALEHSLLCRSPPALQEGLC
jgi:hypothetical protein